MKPIKMFTNRRKAAACTLGAVLLLTVIHPPGTRAETGEPADPAPPSVSLPAVCSASVLTVSPGSRMDVPGSWAMERTGFTYTIDNPKVARVTAGGLIVPMSQGTARLSVGRTAGAEPAGVSAAACEVPVRVSAVAAPKLAFAPKAETRKIKAGGKTFSVQVVTLPKGMPADVALASDKVGASEDFQRMASRRGAEFGINGTYFEAYKGVPDPWGTVIEGGEVVHMSAGTTIGFTADGTAKMDFLRFKIEGSNDGSYKWPNNWYAYFINHTPKPDGNAATIFTPKRGAKTGFAYGTAIVVQQGVVTKIAQNEDVDIPKNGFVLVLTGSEVKQAERFAVGKPSDYRIRCLNAEGEPNGWEDVVAAVGAGPRLLTGGKVTIDAKKEGFTQDKILLLSAARSGIGIKADGSLVLVTAKATIRQLADILKSLGAVQGMNLDGGASSGLYAKGKMLTKPGRLISNSLVFGGALKFTP